MKLGILALNLVASVSFGEAISREQLSELHQIRAEIKTAVFDQARFKQDILKSQLDIESQNQEIQKNEIESNEIKGKILDRIATLYKIRRAYPQGSWLSFAKEEDFLRKSYYLNYLNGQDKKLVSEYKSKRDTTHKLKEKVQAYMSRLQLLQKRNEQKFADLKIRETKQRELIRKIREAIRAQEPQHKNLEDKKFFSELRGELNLPLKGNFVGNFGILRDPKSKLTQLKTGLTVSSAAGSEVQSIYDGEVLYTDVIDGWGPTIIIDHGESYYSVYSHIKNLSVRPGEHVQAQQKLAEVSPLTYHKEISEPGLYFEIRHYSEPEDPRLWLKGVQQ